MIILMMETAVSFSSFLNLFVLFLFVFASTNEDAYSVAKDMMDCC